MLKISAIAGSLILACTAAAQESPAVPASKPPPDMPVIKDKFVRPREIPVRNLYGAAPTKSTASKTAASPSTASSAAPSAPAMPTADLLKAYEHIISEQNKKIEMLEKKVSELESRK